MIKHNYLAIFVLIIIHMAVGFLWYGVIFSEMWSMAVYHKSVAQMQEEMQQSGYVPVAPYIINVIGIVCISLFISWLVQKLNVRTFMGGVFVGFYITLGIVVPVLATHYAFMPLGKRVMVLDCAMSGLLMLITGGILAAWRRR